MVSVVHLVEKKLRSNPEGMTISGIARDLDINRNTVARYLDTLLASGKVEMRPIGSAKVFFLSKRVPLSRLMDVASDIILLMDENYVIVQANNNFAELVGLKKEDLVGMSLKNSPFTVLSDSDLVSHMVAVLDGSHSMMKLCLQRDKGVKHFVLTLLPTILGDGRSGIWLLAEDTTTRVLAEESLKASELKYRTLVEQSSEGILIGQGYPPRIFFVNSTMCDILGYTYDEMIALSSEEIMELIYEDEREQYFQNIRDRWVGKPAPESERVRVVRKNGGLVWLDTYPKVINYEGNPALQVTYVNISEQKKAEESLRKSEIRYRSLFEDSSISLWEEDFSQVKEFFDDLRASGVTDFRNYFESHPKDVERCMKLVDVLDVNKATMKLYNVEDKSQLIGPLSNIFGKDGLRVFREMLIALADGQTFFWSDYVQLTVRERCGVFTFQIGVPLEYENSLAKVHLSIIDVTRQHNVENALRESEEMYRTLFQSISDMIFVLDKNDCFSQIYIPSDLQYLVPQEQFIGKPVTAILHSHMIEPALELIRVLRATGEATSVDYSLDIKGEQRWFSTLVTLHEDGESIVIVMRDITERKLSEAALKESELRYRELFTSTSASIGITNLDDILVYVNQAFADTLGYDVEELTGMSLFRLIPSHEVEKILKETTDRKEGISSVYDLKMSRKDGGQIVVRVSAVPRRDENGVVTGVFGYMVDITEHTQALEKLTKQIQSERLVRGVAERLLIAGNQEQAVINSLSDVASLLKADRASIFLFSKEMKMGSMKYEWCSPGASCIRNKFQNKLVSASSWWMNLFESKSPICIQDVSTIPNECKAESALLQSLDIQSLILAPLLFEQETRGFLILGFENDSIQSDGEYNTLQACADIIVNVLHTEQS